MTSNVCVKYECSTCSRTSYAPHHLIWVPRPIPWALAGHPGWRPGARKCSLRLWPPHVCQSSTVCSTARGIPAIQVLLFLMLQKWRRNSHVPYRTTYRTAPRLFAMGQTCPLSIGDDARASAEKRCSGDGCPVYTMLMLP